MPEELTKGQRQYLQGIRALCQTVREKKTLPIQEAKEILCDYVSDLCDERITTTLEFIVGANTNIERIPEGLKLK